MDASMWIAKTGLDAQQTRMSGHRQQPWPT
jgi:hypothetical protein